MTTILLVTAAAIVLGLMLVGKVPMRYTIRNVTVRWKTTFLTALAFTLVISLLTVMLAFVNGMRRLAENTGEPNNVLVIADGATDEVFSNLAVGELSEIENQPAVVRNEANRPLASREAYMVVNQPRANPRPGGTKRRFLQVRGLDDPVLAAQVHNIALLPGSRWFSQAGVRNLPSSEPTNGASPSAIETVLGEGVAHELGRDRTPEQLAVAQNPQRLEIGDTFVLGNRPWLVVGIMNSANSTFNSEIWAKRSLVGSLFGKDTYTTLVLRTHDAQSAARFADFLKNDYKKARVTALLETAYYADMAQTNQVFLFAIVFVTIWMSIGGVFGIMNTMFAAISQRIKDIGVLRLLGFARWQILVSFLLESLVIALVGGLLGCALGVMVDGWTATSVITGSSGAGRTVVLTLLVDQHTITVGILVTLAMGLVGGLVPALSAMRLTPLEALR